jgi:hypothetical protein
MTKLHKRSPRHLSDTTLILLGRAADSENRMLLPIPKTARARGNALERTLRSLLRQGFVEEVRVGLADEAWRSGHGGCYGLRITEAGLRAIGVPALESGLVDGDESQAALARPAQIHGSWHELRTLRAISHANASSMPMRGHQACTIEIAQCR